MKAPHSARTPRRDRDEDDNPFRLRLPDEQIFVVRDQERTRRQQERENVKNLRVHEKTTASARAHPMRWRDDVEEDAVIAAKAAESARSSRRVHSESVGRDPRREKENVTGFVAKKREMFLVQMSLDVKKAEILKLDEKARMKEEALNKSRQMLDDDVTRFDSFLNNNDKLSHKAMKHAEDKAKEKQEKLQKIKTLKGHISVIHSDISKHREQRDECLKYKGFLEKLTPAEWKEKKLQEKHDRKKKRKADWLAAKMAEINARMQAEIEAEDRAADEAYQAQQKARGARSSLRRKEEEEARERQREAEQRRRRIIRRYPTEDTVAADYQEVSSGEEMPLYFEEPKQLLDVYTSLEESNLFLIQNSQETEQALEEIQTKFAETRKGMGVKTVKMSSQIALLEKQIGDQKSQCEQLRQVTKQKGAASQQDKLLVNLQKQVLEVHNACGFDSDADPNTLQMLMAIERKLEELFAYLDEAEEAGYRKTVEEKEREKYRERRDNLREKKMNLMEQRKVERQEASLSRSQAPIKPKVGKQLMFRSPPAHQARRVVEEDDGYEEAVHEHNVFGIWLNKDGLPSADPPVRPS